VCKFHLTGITGGGGGTFIAEASEGAEWMNSTRFPPRAIDAFSPSVACRTKSEKPYSLPGAPAATPAEMVGFKI